MDLNLIKQIPLNVVLKSQGIALVKEGRGYKCKCPFHDDKTASFSINHRSNLYKCFGCGEAGSVIDLVMKLKQIELPEAIGFLKQNHNSYIPSLAGNNAGNSSNDKAPLDIYASKYQKALQIVIHYYHNCLKENKKPVDYLIKRGIRFGELASEFKIGYADGTLLEKIPKDDGELQECLRELGLITKSGEYFKDYLVFPIIDEEGFITEIYGRSLLRDKTKHLYMPGPHRGFFNSRALIQKEIILCESIIDALSIMTLGLKNVTASYGTGGFTDEMTQAFIKRGIEKVYIAFDNDTAGKRGTLKVLEKLELTGIKCYRILLEKSSDANDFIRKTDKPAERFNELILSAENLLSPAKRESNNVADNSRAGVSSSDDVNASGDTTPASSLAGSLDAGAAVNLQRQEKDGQYVFTNGPRKYTVRGLHDNTNATTLKVFIRVTTDSGFYNDNGIDLYTAKSVNSLINGASSKLKLDTAILRGELDTIIIELEKIYQKKMQDKNKPEKTEYKINLSIQRNALAFLKEPACLKIFTQDLEKCGLVGEPLVGLFCYLATFSRNLPEQLHVIIQAESSAGKSTILNLISSLVPPEDLHYFTQISPKSFYHAAENEYIGKCIAIAESDGMDAALYPIKQMMSEKKLSIASTKTDPKTGEHIGTMKTREVRSQITLTAPREGLDEEVINRCAIASLNETEAQTKRIQELQRLMRSPKGVYLRREKQRLIEFYQHVSREISPLTVINDFTKYFNFASGNHRTRRDHQKYLTLIECITLFFQHQREIIIDTTGERQVKTHLIDIALGHFIVRRLFKATLDELPSQTRSFFNQVAGYMNALAEKEHIDILNVWIYRKDMRFITKLSNTRVHEHARRLVSFEYMSARRDENGLTYRLRFRPDENTEVINKLELVSMSFLKRKASPKQRQEYADFIPHLKEIFKALDLDYIDGEY